jgi:hypothetical protein
MPFKLLTYIRIKLKSRSWFHTLKMYRKCQSITAKDVSISNEKLCKTVKDAEHGLIDADYGCGVIKQRIARHHEGKSGGYRSIIFYCRDDRAFFVYGFPKNAQDNITKADVKEYKELAKITFSLYDEKLEKLVQTGAFKTVTGYG